MAIKGKRILNKAISAELAPFGISRCVLGTEYSYSFEQNDIIFKLELAYEDELFSDFMRERFDYDDTGIEFLISLLHEVGHSKANEEIEGSIYEFCEAEKYRISEAMNKATTKEEVKKLEFEYFNLPDEIMATAWAVNYAKQHPLEIQIMWAVMREAILNFYKANGVTED
jgi:hypothetical protein